MVGPQYAYAAVGAVLADYFVVGYCCIYARNVDDWVIVGVGDLVI